MKTKVELMSEIYRNYLEMQKMDDADNGYANYRGTSAKKIAEQIMKNKVSARDRQLRPEFQNAGLKQSVTEEMLVNILEDILATICDAKDGWRAKAKNGDVIYYHPDYVRNIDINWVVLTKEREYDPKFVVQKAISELRNHNKLFVSGVNFSSSLNIFGNCWSDGNFYSRACVSFKENI
jgi:hypothetical protein